MSKALYYMAQCYTCGGKPQPFMSHADRETWATGHHAATGHPVGLYLEVKSA